MTEPEFTGLFAPVFRFGLHHEWFARQLDRFTDRYTATHEHDNEVDCTCQCDGCNHYGHCGVDYTGCGIT